MKRAFFLLLAPVLVLANACPSHPCLPPCPCEPNPCCPRRPAYGFEVPCEWAILNSAGPKACKTGRANSYLEAAFIWWTAREDGLAFATTGVNGTSDEPSGSGLVSHPDWQWKPGFKVRLGRNLRWDDWDMSATYTWIDFSGNRGTANDPDTSSNTNDLVPLWFDKGIPSTLTLNFPFGDTLLNASGKWKMFFQSLDLEVGKNYFASQMLTLRPFIGLKLTKQDEKYRVRYQFSEGNEENALDIVRIRQKQNFWGVGIRSGSDAHFFITRNVSLFGSFALSALMSHFDVRRVDRLNEVGETPLINLNTTNDFYSMKGVLELLLGMQFNLWIGQNHRYYFQFNAGWEEQLFWNHNQFIHRMEISSHGDLMLHGLTLKARLDF